MNDSLVVLISGKIGSGKSTFASMLQKHLSDKSQILAFATPLKQLCRDAFLPVTSYINEQIITYGGVRSLITSDDNWWENKTQLTRKVLQIVGTDIVRRIDDSYWIKQAIAAINQSNKPIILFSDWRFPDEHSLIDNSFPTITIRLERTTPIGLDAIVGHVSETSLDDFVFDHILDNSGTLSDLDNKAYNMACYLINETLP
jgi:energy-coupling factor transporter ATP-binding protein EcfA2